MKQFFTKRSECTGQLGRSLSKPKKTPAVYRHVALLSGKPPLKIVVEPTVTPDRNEKVATEYR